MLGCRRRLWWRAATGGRQQRLVGYVVAAAGAAVLEPPALRAALARVLPDYMVPSALVVLERLPLTPNGKLDRVRCRSRSLRPAVRGRAGTPQEAILCELFAEVLGLRGSGSTTTSSRSGGDSIVSIQLVSRARRAGCRSRRARCSSIRRWRRWRRLRMRQRACVAAAPRRPIWRGLRSVLAGDADHALAAGAGGPLGRFSQAMLLAVPAGCWKRSCGRRLRALLDHHDALRLRLDGTAADGAWRLEIAPPGAAGASVRRVAVDDLDAAELDGLIAAEAVAAERRLDPAAGAMVQVVWFDAGGSRPGRLLMTIHHLRSMVCRGGSWCRIWLRSGRRSPAARRLHCRRGGHRSGAGPSTLRRVPGTAVSGESFRSGVAGSASLRCC
jgi:hypothetical protein